MAARVTVAGVECHPLTPDRWADLKRLFGERGACEGCWCAFWRLPRARYGAQKGEANRQAMKALVDTGVAPGVLAYVGGEPVGWCSVGPRESFPALDQHTRVLRRVDEKPVWSVVCFYVAKPYRRRGLTVELLAAAADHAFTRRASILEGYPVQPKKGKIADLFACTGLVSAFARAGFVEVGRLSETRPIMRLALGQRPSIIGQEEQ